MIEQVIKKYDFSRIKWKSKDECAILDPVFAVNFKAVPSELCAGPLFSSPALRVVVENKTIEDSADLRFDRDLQNYFQFKNADGSCPVIEGAIFMQCDPVPWKVGIPLALLKDQDKEYEFTLLFDNVHFSILCDGEVIDSEAPFEGSPVHDHKNNAGFDFYTDTLKDFRFTNDLTGLEHKKERVITDEPITCYTPRGFNAWIGDVVPFFFQGVFHIFYLYDRRHHQSRRGMGAHEFWHLTSTDLKNWVDHGPVAELAEPWQSYGTGNAFIYDDKLHLSFGWHTERSKPWKERADQLFYNSLSSSGHTGEFYYDQLGTLTPSGASYFSSSDGINFTPSGKLMHYLKNPCIFPQADGMLHLYQEGKWESDHLGCWRLTDKTFPPSGKESFARNCLDCPSFFTLGGWEYFMVGFSGFFGREAGTEEWLDFTKAGWEPYDGVCVPMVTEFKGRIIEGSWPGGLGWGSCLVMREFVALGNGRLGKKWIDEMMPQFGVPESVGQMFSLPDGKFSLFEMEIEPSDKVFSVLITDAGNEKQVEFSIDFENKRAQWSSIPGKRIMSFREKMMEHPEYSAISQFDDIHFMAEDYAKEELIALDDDLCRLKMFICRDSKSGTTLIDIELNGSHTMLTQRKEFYAGRLSFHGGKNITFSKAV